MDNEAPLLWAGNVADFIEGVDGSPYDDGSGGPVTIDPYLQIEDDGVLVSATVAITGNFQADEDVLAFLNSDPIRYGDISVSGYAAGILTLISASGIATTAQWNAALQAVTYENLSDDPDPGQRTVTFIVSDGVSQSNPADGTALINIIANNDAPSGTDLTIGVAQNGAHVLTLADFGFVDADNHAFSSVVLYGPLTGTGQLFYDPDGTLVEATPFNLGAWEISAEDIAAGKYLYRAAPNSTGIAGSFSFAVRDDGGLMGTGIGWDTDETLNTMTFEVTTSNHAPDLTPPTVATVGFQEGGLPTKLMQGVELSDVDGVLSFAGGSLTISVSGSGGAIELAPPPYIGAVTAFSLSGTDVILNESGLVVGTISGHGTTSVTVTPNASAHPYVIELLARAFIFYDDGSDIVTDSRTVTLTFNDGGLNGTGTPLSDSVTQTLNTFSNGPVADSFITGEGAAALGSVLSNDVGELWGVEKVNGQAAFVDAPIVLASGAILTVTSGGEVSYDPNGAFDHLAQFGLGASNDTATDSFTYTSNGGETVTVTIQIRGQYSAPHELKGTSGNDVITGTAFADTFASSSGNDTMTGLGGNDVYGVNGAGDVVVESGGGGTDKVISSITYVLGTSVENLSLAGGANIDGTGNGAVNVIIGNGGANRIDGGAGADILEGKSGDDLYIVDHVSDKVFESAGEGVDRVDASVSYSIAGQHIEILDLTGTGDLKGTGNGLDNIITGTAGANYLNGGTGADEMNGGAGNDRYVVDNLGDVVIESSAAGGTDRVDSKVSFTLAGTFVETLTLTGNAVANATGNGLANTIVGNNAGNVIDGGTGADTMEGKGGNDRFVVDHGGDKVFELAGEGNDTVDASVTFSLAGQFIETLRLTGAAVIDGTGNNQANSIFGNAAANTINASGGDDKIYGGAGNDTLTGGGGQDRFTFDSALNAATNVDRILDFSVADDGIYLDRAVFSGVTSGTLSAGAFVNGNAAVDAGDRILYDKATGNIFYDADGTGAGVALLFASVAAGTTLTNADFIGF